MHSLQKRLIIVRHGETESNRTDDIQTHDEPLTTRGIAQARRVGARLAERDRYPIDAIVSSTMERARQTASEIGRRIGVAPGVSPLFIERLYPVWMRGGERKDPAIASALDEMRARFHDPSYDPGQGGENYTKFRARMRTAHAYIEAHPSKCLCIVTHGVSGSGLASELLLGDMLDEPHIGSRLFCDICIISPNTGVMEFAYGKTRSYDGERTCWQMVGGDTSHFW